MVNVQALGRMLRVLRIWFDREAIGKAAILYALSVHGWRLDLRARRARKFLRECCIKVLIHKIFVRKVRWCGARALRNALCSTNPTTKRADETTAQRDARRISKCDSNNPHIVIPCEGGASMDPQSRRV